MPQPPEVQALADELARLYTDVQDSLISQLQAVAQDPNQHRLRARLTEQSRAISQALDEVDVQAKTFLSRRFPEVYQYGAMEAAQATGRPFMWSQIHLDAVSELANTTYDDLLKSTRFVRRDTKRFIREAVRARSAEAVIGGQTSTQVGRALAKELAEQGIGAIRYANGAKHTLKDYADMVIRTSTAQAHNGGVLNAGREAGIKWYHVSDGLDCGWTTHKDSDLAAGTVRTAEECAEYPISHPRCARGLSPAPEVTTEAEARAARQYEPDEQLRLAEEERERARTHTVEGRLTQREKTRREGQKKRELARREREKTQGKAKRERERKREKAKRGATPGQDGSDTTDEEGRMTALKWAYRWGSLNVESFATLDAALSSAWRGMDYGDEALQCIEVLRDDGTSEVLDWDEVSRRQCEQQELPPAPQRMPEFSIVVRAPEGDWGSDQWGDFDAFVEKEEAIRAADELCQHMSPDRVQVVQGIVKRIVG